MKYIWINPVTDSMYDTKTLNEFLSHHGYERVDVSENWLDIVKDKYKMAVNQTENTVIDMRCPKIKEMIEEYPIHSKITIPDIYPILIHCAQEISEREDLGGCEKVITTPCQCLADMGNRLELEDTRFVSWNQFMASTGEVLQGIQQMESPIPPGFFDGTGITTTSITGEEEIRKYFENFRPGEVQLAEMLFCKNGCHNGDGVRMCEE